jgi:septal ring factor EnvC (AmiA/AmiB activator)
MTFSDSLIRWPLICCVCSLAMMSAAAQGQQLREWPKEQLVEQLEYQKKELEGEEQKLREMAQQLDATQTEIESATNERIQLDQAIARSRVAPESYKEVLILLQTMRVQLQIDLAGLYSKREALRIDQPEKSKEQFIKQALLLEKKLEIAKRIESLSIELRDKAKEQFKNGVVSLGELNKLTIEAETASFRVVELEAEILEKEASASEWSRPVLAAIQQTGLEIAEKEARLGKVDEQLAAAIRVGREIEESNQMMQRIAGLEQRRDSIKEKVGKLESTVKERMAAIKKLEEELAKR